MTDAVVLRELPTAVVLRTRADRVVLRGGIPGSTTGTDSYTHPQTVPSATWTINHGLGFYPDVSLVIGGVDSDADITHPSVNQTVVTFPTPMTGVARLV